jgi:hypothetical protein
VCSDPACPARVSCVGGVLPSGTSPCGWLSQPPTTMPDKTPPWHTAVADLPGPSLLDASTRAHAVSGLFTRSCPRPVGFIVSPRPGALGASRVLQRLSSGMPGLKDSGGPPHPSHKGCFVLPSRTLKLSASATSLFRSCTSTSGNAIFPYGLQDSLCTLAPSCSRVAPLRHGTNTRYGRAAHPYPTGTLTRQETPSFARRDNV